MAEAGLAAVLPCAGCRTYSAFIYVGHSFCLHVCWSLILPLLPPQIADKIESMGDVGLGPIKRCLGEHVQYSHVKVRGRRKGEGGGHTWAGRGLIAD